MFPPLETFISTLSFKEPAITTPVDSTLSYEEASAAPSFVSEKGLSCECEPVFCVQSWPDVRASYSSICNPDCSAQPLFFRDATVRTVLDSIAMIPAEGPIQSFRYFLAELEIMDGQKPRCPR